MKQSTTYSTRHACIESLRRRERVANWLALIVIIAMAIFVGVNLFGIAAWGW